MVSFARKLFGIALLACYVQSVALAQSVAIVASQASGTAGGTASFNLSMTTSGGAQPVAIEFTIGYSSADISNIAISAAGTAVSAGKSLACSPAFATTTCVLYGNNATALPSGIIAQATVTLSSTAINPSTAIQVSGAVVSDATGSSIAATAAGSQIAIAIQPGITTVTLTGVACSPGTITGVGKTSCTVSLSGAAPAAGFAVAFSSNNANLTVPASVTVPAGASSAVVSATAVAVASNQSAVITASANGVTQTSTVSLVASSVQLTSLACSPGTITGTGIISCTVSLSGTAAAGFIVALSSNNANLTVPASITVPVGASSTVVSATAIAVAAVQSAVITASASGVTKTSTVSLVASALQLTRIACLPGSITGASQISCTVSLSGAAPAAGFAVAVSSSNANVTVPASVTVPAAAASTVVSAAAVAVASNQSAVITASANGIKQASTIALMGPAILTSFSCNPATVPSGSSATCTVALSGGAPTSGAVIALTGGTAILSIPSSVTIPAGAISATFAAAASGTISAAVPLTATWNGVPLSFTLSVGSQLTFSLLGNPSEAHGISNGSNITPTIAPSGLAGTVVVNGTGSVNFSPDQAGNGVYFMNCCTNNNNAYYKFTGSAVGNIFNFTQGQVAFTLKSRYNLAQRALATSYRAILDVRDGNSSNHLITFTTVAASGRLVFYYNVGAVTQYYYAPQGTENALFGAGVAMQVALTWRGGHLNLYLNGILMKSTTYSAPTPNWTPESVFDVGAYGYMSFNGYDSCDDIISDFTVGPVTQN